MMAAQCQAVRGLVNFSQDTLAEEAAVSATALCDFERGATVPVRNSLAALQHALEAAGVEFIVESRGGPGVSLRKP